MSCSGPECQDAVRVRHKDRRGQPSLPGLLLFTMMRKSYISVVTSNPVAEVLADGPHNFKQALCRIRAAAESYVHFDPIPLAHSGTEWVV
jgi:hypothetical protein